MKMIPNIEKGKFHKSIPNLKSPKLEEKYGVIKKMQNMGKAKEIFGEYFIRRRRNRMCRFYAERCRSGEIPKKRKDVYDVHLAWIWGTKDIDSDLVHGSEIGEEILTEG